MSLWPNHVIECTTIRARVAKNTKELFLLMVLTQGSVADPGFPRQAGAPTCYYNRDKGESINKIAAQFPRAEEAMEFSLNGTEIQ